MTFSITARRAVAEISPATARGATVWFTGLSGAGKSTVAKRAAGQLRSLGRAVEVLDGDEFRARVSPDLGFSHADRQMNVARVGYVAQMLSRNGVLALVPVIAPYAAGRAELRGEHEKQGIGFLEVYVATPLGECMRRDVKGLYAAAQAGVISALTGVDDPYEAPEDPELRLDTTYQSVGRSAAQVVELLRDRGLA